MGTFTLTDDSGKSFDVDAPSADEAYAAFNSHVTGAQLQPAERTPDQINAGLHKMQVESNQKYGNTGLRVANSVARGVPILGNFAPNSQEQQNYEQDDPAYGATISKGVGAVAGTGAMLAAPELAAPRALAMLPEGSEAANILGALYRGGGTYASAARNAASNAGITAGDIATRRPEDVKDPNSSGREIALSALGGAGGTILGRALSPGAATIANQTVEPVTTKLTQEARDFLVAQGGGGAGKTLFPKIDDKHVADFASYAGVGPETARAALHIGNDAEQLLAHHAIESVGGKINQENVIHTPNPTHTPLDPITKNAVGGIAGLAVNHFLGGDASLPAVIAAALTGASAPDLVSHGAKMVKNIGSAVLPEFVKHNTVGKSPAGQAVINALAQHEAYANAPASN